MEQDDFLARKEQILNRNSAKNFKVKITLRQVDDDVSY